MEYDGTEKDSEKARSSDSAEMPERADEQAVDAGVSACSDYVEPLTFLTLL